MKNISLLILTAGILASCGTSSSNESSSVEDSSSIFESSSSVIESPDESSETSDESSTTSEQPSSTSEEPTRSDDTDQSSTLLAHEYVFNISDFPEKANNTYPENALVEKDGYSFTTSYVMQGNTQDIEGNATPVFQMKKGVAEITSNQKLSGSVTFFYLNKGQYTGALTAYAGTEKGAFNTKIDAEPVVFDEKTYAVSFPVYDTYISIRNESSYALYGLWMTIVIG